MKDLVNREAAPSPPHLPFPCRSPAGTFLAADTHDLPRDLSQGAGSGSAPWSFSPIWILGLFPNFSVTHPLRLWRAQVDPF